MIVQPASLGPRSPRRRVIRALGLALPALLLGTVVAVALAGPTPMPAPSRTPLPTAQAVAVAESPGPTPAPDPDADRVRFPAQIAGLDVHGVEWTLEARSRGMVRGGVVAVAGYLSMDAEPPACADGGDRLGGAIVVPFCGRTGILADDPWPGRADSERDLPGFHLHPQVPVGVRIPLLVGSAARATGSATPVVMIARFDDPRAATCLPAGRHCGQELIVERVAWVDGAPYPRGVAVDPGVPIDGRLGDVLAQADTAVAQLADDGYPLLAALVDPETLATMDGEAAVDLARRGGPDPVWYVRGLRTIGDPSAVEWVIVSEDGERLAAGSSVARAPGIP